MKFLSYLKNYPEQELVPEPHFGFAASRSRSRKSYFRLHNTAINSLIRDIPYVQGYYCKFFSVPTINLLVNLCKK